MGGDSEGAMVDDFDAWYAELRPTMLPALAAWCGDRGVADDALDEAFARAYERWERVRASPSPAGWVWRTAINLVRRHHRRRTVEQRLLRRTFPAPAAADTSDDDLDLRAALLQLTERQRTAVVLHHLVGWPHAEVAMAMGIATGTVAATLHHARARLAAELRPSLADPDPSPVRPSIDGAPT
ncbi:MAG: sigma-70 family RNA polymerase sigma factor [Acidimicrobiales bacterium]